MSYSASLAQTIFPVRATTHFKDLNTLKTLAERRAMRKDVLRETLTSLIEKHHRLLNGLLFCFYYRRLDGVCAEE